MGKKRHAENKDIPKEEPKKVKTHLKEVDIGAQKDVVKHIKKQEKRLIVVLEGNTDINNEKDTAQDDEKKLGGEEKADGKKKRKRKEPPTSKGCKKIKSESPSKKEMTKGPNPKDGLNPAKIKALGMA